VGPVADYLVNQGPVFIEGGGFLKIGVGTKAIGFVDISLQAGPTEENFWDPAIFRMLREPSQNIEAVHAGHFQIGDDKFREGMGRPIGELALAA